MVMDSDAHPGQAPIGEWRVERVSGVLPPGVTKRIGETGGVTMLFGVPVARFRSEGRRLVYRRFPVVDTLTPMGDGTWRGRGLLFGMEFCRFRLVPEDG